MNSWKQGLLAGLIVAAAGSSQALACRPAPAPPEVQRQRLLDGQASLWDRSESVFVALVKHRNQIRIEGAGGALGRDAMLRPTLQLKGPPLTEALIGVRHTGVNSCGPTPSLDALDPKGGGMFIVYSSSASPTAATIIGTVSVDKLREPRAMAAWREAREHEPTDEVD
ncbi:hypothetical protein SGCZBJ_04205 [Caulobacter zeae]|uniref:Uncharacterized protein n=1 Tax=Caulobacter zeae TaxID=2055137 RepID=A0A2N5DQ94_9CAUL|nr:hypothetical protein [Caulobacter zeae]PLR28214.1 hypothetical protein SGCZBJ_04205 [Caulobacter zeae]